MEPPPPTTLCQGRYLLQEILGEGGMATVHRAQDRSLRVERAIKLFSSAASSMPEARARVENEARVMANLHHANVVTIHDIREDEGRIFIVMELIPGGTLWEWVQAHGPLPPTLAVQVMLPVLDAVKAAHTLGVVHRDLKPQNILLDAVGTPHVSDFGIVRILDGSEISSLTRTGSTLGTWPYMAPEQRRDPRSAVPASDVYSLGATLFSLLRGQSPFDLFAAGEDAGLLAGIHPDLAAVIRRATRFKADDRYATVSDLAAALVEILPALPPIPESTPPLGERPESRSGGDLPTADLSSDDSSIITNVDAAGPAADVLYRRRRLLAALEEDFTATPGPRGGVGVWALAAAAPALMALIAGGLVMALDAPPHRLWARRTLVLLGHASVEVRGDPVEVMLEDASGNAQTPGTVSPGTYRVKATFEAGQPPVDVGGISVRAGQLLDLVCSTSQRQCPPEEPR